MNNYSNICVYFYNFKYVEFNLLNLNIIPNIIDYLYYFTILKFFDNNFK